MAIVAETRLVQARLKQGVVEAISVGVGGVILAISIDVRLVAGTITVALRDVAAATVVNGAGTVTHPTSVIGAIAIVHVVTDAVPVAVIRTNARVNVVADSILIDIWCPLAITSIRSDTSASTIIDGARTVADAAFIDHAYAVVVAIIIANAIPVGIF